MKEQESREGEWPLSDWPGCDSVAKALLFRVDGIGRGNYFRALWLGFGAQWLIAPWRCKRGKHRIGPGSDAEIGNTLDPGTLNVECVDCGLMVHVAIDDAIGVTPAIDSLLRAWRERLK